VSARHTPRSERRKSRVDKASDGRVSEPPTTFVEGIDVKSEGSWSTG